MGNPNWDLAGLTGPEALLGRYVQGAKILVPGVVKSAGDQIYWEISLRPPTESPWIDAPKGLLDRFIALRDKENAAILAFAQQFGVLWPFSAREGRRGFDQFEDWRKMTVRAWAIVEMAAFVQAGKPVPSGVLDVLCKSDVDPAGHMEVRVIAADVSLPIWRHRDGRKFDFASYRRPTSKGETAWWTEHGVHIVAAEVSEWIQVGGVSLALTADQGRWDLGVSFQGRLVGALALQLALAVSRSEMPFTCSECGQVYIRGRDEGQERRRRRPNPGWSNFCPHCGRKAAVRAADKRRRASIAEARRLHRDEGLSYAVIAERLDKDLSLVQRWIEKGK